VERGQRVSCVCRGIESVSFVWRVGIEGELWGRGVERVSCVLRGAERELCVERGDIE